MHRFFSQFLAKMKSSFRRIANATRNEVTEEDLHSDAWLIAHEISARRGHDVDFADPEDQDLVIRGVNLQNVRRGDWKMRKAVRIDEKKEGEDGPVAWTDLPAAAASDPLVFILKREAAVLADRKVEASYSQAAAYLRTFTRFGYDRREICKYLAISNETLRLRVIQAEALVLWQPSLFDGIAKIGPRFMPAPGRVCSRKPVRHLGSVQWAWSFNEPSTILGSDLHGDTLH